MNFDNELENTDNPITEIEGANSLSIEDFIKELEAKEKDLQISSDMAIEIDGADFDDTNPPDFIKAEFAIEPVVAAPEIVPVNNFIQNDRLVAELEGKLSQFKLQVSRLEAERAELNEMLRRRQTDFDNYKKRIERDRSDTFLNQLSHIAMQMLPVLDNLDRALDFAANHSEGLSPDFHQFFEGIVLVNQQLNEVLVEMGISPIASVGKNFDPHFHEAVAAEEAADVPPNLVTGELLRGYRIGEKVIRPAMVRVAIAAPPVRVQPKETVLENTAAPAPERITAVPELSELGDDLLET